VDGESVRYIPFVMIEELDNLLERADQTGEVELRSAVDAPP
jgi:hypothetical protein